MLDLHVHLTAWTVVLAASLSMPVLMHRLTFTLPAAAPQCACSSPCRRSQALARTRPALRRCRRKNLSPCRLCSGSDHSRGGSSSGFGLVFPVRRQRGLDDRA
jgi:hypothetical protein